ncbi:glycoside hydrolase family 16 protein [Auriculariales sp. MPI-PUGE-AT-0066]|nr:glycoside hydrolase family 16 protein [Auriculariales sp. MPI-PUGE-AT-0066]
MRATLFSSPCAAVALAVSVSASVIRSQTRAVQPAKWKIADVYKGDSFYDGFEFFTYPDPTDGLVNSFVIRGDQTRKLEVGEKRDSVRISSKKTYAEHVQIADIEHMPEGLGTWPAYWMTGDNWPVNGEIDIIEGANDLGPNLQSLHTTPGCEMNEEHRNQKGRIKMNDCNSFANGNTGCGVFGDSQRDFGAPFNKAGGGWWATVRTESAIKMYFWSRQDPDVPDEVRNGADVVDPTGWGTPTSSFTSSGDLCSISDKFGKNRIIFNLTFCGGFAGHTFHGGTPACEDFVRNNPEAYNLAFWNVLSLRVYEEDN